MMRSIDSIFHQAVRQGSVAVVRDCLANHDGADVHAQDNLGRPALLYAAAQPSTELLQMLIQAGAHVNAHDVYHNRPLDWASKSGNVDAVQILIQHKANTNLKDKFGRTALHRAVGEGHKQVAQILIQAGAKTNIIDKGLVSPFSLAIAKGDREMILMFLLDCGVDPNMVEEGPSGCKQVLATPLHYAVRKGLFDMAELLLNHPQIDVNVRDSAGRTALHLCRHVDVANLLLDHGANVNGRNHDGQTPLHAMLDEYNPDPNVVKILLDRGANVNALNNGGHCPLSLAIASSHAALVLWHDCLRNKRFSLADFETRDIVYRRVIDLLLCHGADIHLSASKNGPSPLSLACEFENLDLIHLQVRRCLVATSWGSH